MKKIIFLFAILFCFSFNFYSQSNAKWSQNGDNINPNDWLGTTNNEPLLLKANNNLGIKIKTNGELMFKSLDLNSNNGPDGIVFADGQGRIFRLNFTGNQNDFLMGNGTWGNLPSGATSWSVVANNLINTNTGNVGIGTNNPQHKLDVSGSFGMNGAFVNSAWLNGGTRLLQVDASGNVSPFTMGNYNDVLFGNGTWAALPSAINYFSANGNALFTNPSTSVGIGTGNPQYMLDVNGDVHVQKNLYVDGQILITDKVESGTINTDTIRADTGSIVIGDTRIVNKFEVGGNSRFAGTLQADQGIMFDATNNRGISFTPASLSSRATFNYGNQTTALATCITPNTGNSDPFHIFTGFVTSRATNGQVNAAVSIGSAPWDGNGIIEVEGTDQLGGTNNGLLINYFCGRNTLINVNNGLANGGGTIFMGNKVDMAGSVKVGYSGNTTFDPNTSMELYNSGNANWNGIKFVTPWSGSKVISISNSNFPVSPFTLFADGRVNLSTVAAYNNQKIFSIDNAASTVFEVLGNGKTTLNIDPSSSTAAFEIKDVVANKTTYQLATNGSFTINLQSSLSGTNAPSAIEVRDLANVTNFKVKSSGSVFAKEVTIQTATFPDYVFDKSYKLLSLSDVENFIESNKHLPGFKKGSEYEKDGLNVNELLLKQQEKIEELTLYIIDLEKRMKKVETSSK